MVQSPAREREVVRGRLPAARRDRRPALAALAVLLILLGALGSALIAFRSGDRVSVLVASHDIRVGQQMQASDFRAAKVAGDTSDMVAASALRQYIGSRAVVGIPGRSFVSPGMFSRGRIVPDGAEEVGVVVSARQRPSRVPSPGDVVKLYYVTSDTAQSGQQQYAPGDAVVDAARVLAVRSGGSGDTVGFTVVVKRASAGIVASLSASSNLAVTVLPSDTQPDVDITAPGQ